ncbi:unnamed protein product, partial [Ectocarpus sp. 12 AP-2014]
MEQEGWHYELEDTSDPLTYKGVVFNEMKGVYSSPDSLHGRTCQQVTNQTPRRHHECSTYLHCSRSVFAPRSSFAVPSMMHCTAAGARLPQDVLWLTIFPDNAYGVDSGGDPTAIPSLTFEYFKGFHQRFYHPGNSRVYFYGDDPP